MTTTVGGSEIWTCKSPPSCGLAVNKATRGVFIVRIFFNYLLPFNTDSSTSWRSMDFFHHPFYCMIRKAILTIFYFILNSLYCHLILPGHQSKLHVMNDLKRFKADLFGYCSLVIHPKLPSSATSQCVTFLRLGPSKNSL